MYHCDGSCIVKQLTQLAIILRSLKLPDYQKNIMKAIFLQNTFLSTNKCIRQKIHLINEISYNVSINIIVYNVIVTVLVQYYLFSQFISLITVFLPSPSNP